MKTIQQLCAAGLLAVLLAPAVAFGQDAEERGMIEFGFQALTGSVDGRTYPGGVPFSNGFRPSILNSGINTYSDYRNSFFVPRAWVYLPDAFGGKSYFSLKTANYGLAAEGGTMIRNQSLIAAFGREHVYKLQFLWDQTPHIFSGTTRSLFSQTSPGIWNFNGNKSVLDAARVAGTGTALFDALKSQTANAWPDVQGNIRRTAGALADWNINPSWNVALSFSREFQAGTRPNGMCFGNNPSCFWAEIPENLSYRTNTLKAETGVFRNLGGVQLGYERQTFENQVHSQVVENPFSNGNNSATVTAKGQMGLYPDNQAQDVVLGGAVHFGRVHVMSNITPGWETQNDPFVPYTANTFLLGRTGSAAPLPLPVSSLDGNVRTLAMNYTVVANPLRNVELTARYRHYDYNNNTESHVFNPYVGDLAAEAQLAGPSGQEVLQFAGVGGVVNQECRGVCNEPTSFNTRRLELGATWFFGKKSSAKVEYGREWFNRHHRDVDQTIEDTVRAALDVRPQRNLGFRFSAAHGNREPQDRDYEWALLPGTQRPDEGFRRRNRADLAAMYDLTDRLSVSAFFGITQDDFNRRSSLSSLTPLGDPSLVTITKFRPTPIIGPYYVYGVLNDSNWNIGGEFSYVLANEVTLFGQYSRERNKNRMVSRQRSRNTASQLGCPSSVGPEDCDPINDWTTFARDVVDNYFVGLDWNASRKLRFSFYYNLSAAKGIIFSDGVNCQIGNGPNDFCRANFPNWRLDNATNPAVTFNFPDSSSRLHESSAIVRFNLTNRVSPKLEYRYEHFGYRDFQTSIMNPMSYIGPGPDPSGTTGLQRMLFLGADTPGYKAHVVRATLEYRF